MNLPCVSSFDPAPRDGANSAALNAAWASAAAGAVDDMLPLDLRQPASMELSKMLTEYGDSALLARAMKAAFANTNTAGNNASAGSLFRQWVESACIGYANDNEGAF